MFKNPVIFYRSLLPTIVGLLALAVGGCASAPVATVTPRIPKVLVAIQVAGGAAPTAAQTDKVQRAMASRVAAAGMEFAHSFEEAGYILKVVLTPDLFDPEGGHLAAYPIEPLNSSPPRATTSKSDAMDQVKNSQRQEMSRVGTSEAAHE